MGQKVSRGTLKGQPQEDPPALYNGDVHRGGGARTKDLFARHFFWVNRDRASRMQLADLGTQLFTDGTVVESLS